MRTGALGIDAGIVCAVIAVITTAANHEIEVGTMIFKQQAFEVQWDLASQIFKMVTKHEKWWQIPR